MNKPGVVSAQTISTPSPSKTSPRIPVHNNENVGVRKICNHRTIHYKICRRNRGQDQGTEEKIMIILFCWLDIQKRLQNYFTMVKDTIGLFVFCAVKPVTFDSADFRIQQKIKI